jgi:uncharacterized protein YbjT (DUF2867 family)
MKNILVTGAAGYIGGRLVPSLLEAGHSVRVVARDVKRLSDLPWANQVETIEADLNVEDSVGRALMGIDVAYYLVHSMGSGEGFHRRDLEMANLFAQKAREAHVERIIYLGALGHESTGLTEHLRSRQETGRYLANFGGEVIELRAGPVVGAGSLPFEMIRYLTERVPVMICPRWVFTKVQPIGLSDVLAYLVASIGLSAHGHQIVEIGGRDIVSYGQMMTGYARVRGLRRVMIRVPVLTPRLSSLWVHLITPLRGSFARPIVEGLRNEVVVHDPQALNMFPEIAPLGYESAVRSALDDLRPSGLPPTAPLPGTPEGLVVQTTNNAGIISESRSIYVAASRQSVFDAFTTLGGEQGWYMDWGWRLRGAADWLLGGPGLRRTRPSGDVKEGDQVDFWRVESITQGQSLLLRAEMKLPGAAWLEFTATTFDGTCALLTQTSYFAPKGLAGVIYWYVLLPIHKSVFNGLIRRISTIATGESHRRSSTS